VHFVTAELDHGAIVAQAVVPVLGGDDEASLSARVLKLEHRMYPRAVRWFVEGQLAIADGRVRQLAGESQSFS
jgi:phosphoribosylglycinamide formyltransferase-1